MWIIPLHLGKQPTGVGSIVDGEKGEKGLVSCSCSYHVAKPGFEPRHFDLRTQTVPSVGTK